MQKQVERAMNSYVNLYRPKGYDKEVRRKMKRRNKTSWYKLTDSFLFCSAISKGDLAKKIR